MSVLLGLFNKLRKKLKRKLDMLKPMTEYNIGQTPIQELPSINGNRIFIKLEQANFLGSVKARTGYSIIKALEPLPGITIIESTSGNLGLALDFFAKKRTENLYA